MNKRRRFQAKRRRALLRQLKRPTTYCHWIGVRVSPETLALIEQDMRRTYQACISDVMSPGSFDMEWKT